MDIALIRLFSSIWANWVPSSFNGLTTTVMPSVAMAQLGSTPAQLKSGSWATQSDSSHFFGQKWKFPYFQFAMTSMHPEVPGELVWHCLCQPHPSTHPDRLACWLRKAPPETIEAVRSTKQVSFNVQGVSISKLSFVNNLYLNHTLAVSWQLQQSFGDWSTYVAWRSWKNSWREMGTATVRLSLHFLPHSSLIPFLSFFQRNQRVALHEI